MVAGIVQWAKHQPEVRQIEAETNIDNRASIRVLEKNSFVCVGVGWSPIQSDFSTGTESFWHPHPSYKLQIMIITFR
jgi:RimJ/RimL family protein N-acetyltransferase